MARWAVLAFHPKTPRQTPLRARPAPVKIRRHRATPTILVLQRSSKSQARTLPIFTDGCGSQPQAPVRSRGDTQAPQPPGARRGRRVRLVWPTNAHPGPWQSPQMVFQHLPAPAWEQRRAAASGLCAVDVVDRTVETVTVKTVVKPEPVTVHVERRPQTASQFAQVLIDLAHTRQSDEHRRGHLPDLPSRGWKRMGHAADMETPAGPCLCGSAGVHDGWT